MRFRNHGSLKIFAEAELRQYLESRLQSAAASIESENDEYLLNVNEGDYVSHKVSETEVELLEIHDDQIYVSSSEQYIPADRFSRDFNVRSGKSYKKDVVKFHIPFSGNSELLRYAPSSRLMWSMEVEISDNEICFEIINFRDDSDSIVREKDSNVQRIKQQLGKVESEVSGFNSNLERQITDALKARKSRIMAKTGVLASLGVPIKKSSAPPETFAAPSVKKKKKVVLSKPEVKESNFTPEPTLDESVYFDILKMIHDVGKEFERLPSLYAGKDEEHLRDHFLMILEPNFEGSATGETFNKTGKTDILLRHEGSNVFIGECKFWSGKKNFLGTISQLLGYLSWRDSKAAVIVFVPNKDFSSVVETVMNCIDQHPNYLQYVSANDETWLNYEFHIDGDRNRKVRVAVMLFHTPKGS